MSAEDELAGTHTASRYGDHAIKTVINGRVTAKMARAWGEDWARLHPPGAPGATIWFFDAMRLVTYSSDAPAEVTRVMMRIKDLRHVVVASRSTLVRLGATMVHKALRVTTGVEIQIFETLDQAERRVAEISSKS